MTILEWIKNLFKKKEILDNLQRIERATEETGSILSSFVEMAQKLESVNESLDTIMQEENDNINAIKESAEKRIKEAQEKIELASSKLNSNIKLHGKISEFLPE